MCGCGGGCCGCSGAGVEVVVVVEADLVESEERVEGSGESLEEQGLPSFTSTGTLTRRTDELDWRGKRKHN